MAKTRCVLPDSQAKKVTDDSLKGCDARIQHYEEKIPPFSYTFIKWGARLHLQWDTAVKKLVPGCTASQMALSLKFSLLTPHPPLPPVHRAFSP